MYRGTLAYCTACGAPRPPFSAKSVNLAGQPSKIGGSVAKAVGWMILAFGSLIGLTTIWILQLIFPTVAIGWALGVPIVVISLIVGLLTLFGGKKLKDSGVEAERTAKFEAIYAMALTRNGLVTAVDVGRTLGMPVQQADDLLTQMTKAFPEYVSIEVDDAGNLFYKLAGMVPGLPIGAQPPPQQDTFGVKYRVEADGRVRIDDAIADGRAAQAEAEYQAWQEQQKRRS
ncbi:MAG: hypothetical protein ACXVEF_08960 [Polyangiales bacterium]